MASRWLTCPQCDHEFLHVGQWPPHCPECGYSSRPSGLLPAYRPSGSIPAYRPPSPPAPAQAAPRREMTRKTAFIGCLASLALAAALIAGITVVPLEASPNTLLSHPGAAPGITASPTSPGASTPSPAAPTPGSSASTPETTPTTPAQSPGPTASATPQWITIQSFKGSGGNTTPSFLVPTDWLLIWSCTPGSIFTGQYNLIVEVDKEDGTLLGVPGINTICQTGNTGGTIAEHKGGKIFLDVTTPGSWQLDVQVLK